MRTKDIVPAIDLALSESASGIIPILLDGTFILNKYGQETWCQLKKENGRLYVSHASPAGKPVWTGISRTSLRTCVVSITCKGETFENEKCKGLPQIGDYVDGFDARTGIVLSYLPGKAA